MTNTARRVRSVLFVFLTSILTAAAFSPVANRQSPTANPKAMSSAPAVRKAGETSSGSRSLSSAQAQAVQVLSSSTRGVELEFTADSFGMANTATGVAVSAPGFERSAKPGEPDLPSRTVFVGIPQSGNVRLSVATEGDETSAHVQVRPAVGFSERKQETGYNLQARNGLWPTATAEILSIETLRGVRFARIKVNPAQYDAASGTLRMHHRVRVALSFDNAAVAVDRPDALDGVISPMLVNGADAIHWKLDLPTQDSVNFFTRSNVWCRIKTESTGIYRINPADLQAAGFHPESIAPATMKLYSIGPYTINGPYPDTMVEVPVYVKDNGDTKFDKGEYLAFYAESPSYWQVNDTSWRTNDTLWRTNVFTDTNCWWLTWGGENGRRMDSVSGAGATSPQTDAYEHARLELDSLCPARSGLLWLWKDIVKTEGLDTTVPIQLAIPQRDTIRWLRGRFYGNSASAGAHANARIYLNGLLVDSLRVAEAPSTPPAVDFYIDSLPAAAAARAGQSDTLSIELYGDDAAEVYLDYLEVGYSEKLAVTSSNPQLEFLAAEGSGAQFGIDGASGDALILDVTNPFSPNRITNTDVAGSRRGLRLSAGGFRRLWCALPSGLFAPQVVRRTPGNLRTAGDADYYIVCPDEFYQSAKLFARYREGNVAGIPNARVGIAKLSDVYDEYAFGIAEPGAIKHLLQAKRPAYVLLAGDGTYDYRNRLLLRTSPVLPPREIGYDIDPEVYGDAAYALDAWYADIDGSGSAPDLILGRVTVRSAVEFRQFLDRIKRYETQPLGYWAKRYLLLGDDEIEGSYDRPDPLRDDHIPSCEAEAQRAAGLLDPVKVYLTEYPLTSTNLKAEASAEFIRQLNAGALLFCFFGHGAGFQLCHEQALHITNTVPLVNNGSRSPLAFYGSCGVGRFEDTRYEAIAEELVRRDGGTIAGVGATKATSSGTNEELARLMFQRVRNYPDDPIGPAFFQAYTQENTLYHLFGDPATVLRMPRSATGPDVRPDTFYPGGRNTFQAADSVHRKGSYEVSAHEATWHRYYHSTFTDGETWSVNYNLPGYEIHRAAGTFDSSKIVGSFIVPRIPYPETTYVANGWYARLPSTGRVSLLSYAGTIGLSFEHDSIPLDTAVTTTDNQPPQVGLYADNIRLVPGDTNRVPSSFNLIGRLSDASGILIVPVVPGTDPAVQDVALSMKMEGTTTPLSSYFRYDDNSTTSGRFTYPLTMQNALDSLMVTASDNMVDPNNPARNRTRVTVLLNSDSSNTLKLTNCLVYPSPTTGAAKFTFNLSRAALVSVRIYTIAGRLVRVLQPIPCGFDYNQIQWDGLDKDGVPLANGVYLYKLDAEATEVSASGSQSSSASFRDKFIIHR
ncbi:MAG TPA: C25 family cysteine peptidase [bacterium]|nr:C25 family cysteine peptidase [bacterium]